MDEIVIPGGSRNYGSIVEICKDNAEYRRLVDRIEDREVDVIVCRDYDRLWRTPPLQATLSWMCEKNQVQILATNTPTEIVPPERFEQGAEARRITEMMNGYVSYQEQLSRRRRHRKGMINRVTNRKLHPNLIPFGYKDPETQAHWVKWMFTQRCDGWSLGMIAEELNARGVLTPRGGQWSREQVLYVISNPYYKGYIKWGGEITAKGNHEPLVSEETWEQAQHQRKRYNKVSPGPLTSLMRCGVCGGPMAYRRDKKRRADVTCIAYRKRGREACPSKFVLVDDVHPYVRQTVRAVIMDPDGWQAWRNERLRIESLDEEQRAIKAKIAENDRAFANWRRLVDRGLISDEELVVERQRIYANRDALASRLLEIEESQENRRGLERTLQSLQGCIEVFDRLEDKDLHRIYQHLIDYVVIERDMEPVIHWRGDVIAEGEQVEGSVYRACHEGGHCDVQCKDASELYRWRMDSIGGHQAAGRR